jgi:hypothetical protein
LIVSGVSNPQIGQHVDREITAILAGLGSEGFRTQGNSLGGRMTYRITPAPDPRAFADKITFGKVIRVRGRMIDVAASPFVPVADASVGGSSEPPSTTGNEERSTPGSDLVDQLVSDLGSPSVSTRKRALGRIKDLPPGDRRSEVASAIEPLLHDSDGFTRADAAKALGHCGGPENTPALTAALRDPAFNVRWAVFDALKELKDPNSAPALAELLATNDRGKASEVLKAIGPEAEPAVLPYLRNGDAQVRREACRVLQSIGTEQSVPELLAIASKNTGFDSMAARAALNEMAQRNVNTGSTPRRRPRGR